MKRRSRLMETKRAAQVEATRRLTGEERLLAFAEHCRLVMELYEAGRQHRSSVGAVSTRPK